MRAEFEEKQYEVPACIELTSGKVGSAVFSSGQVLERILGYDAAASVDPTHLIWRVLRVPRPLGVTLLPTYWAPRDSPPSSSLPASSVNPILQFKRPERMVHGRAAQWGLWGGPYFRFARTSHQHQVLAHIESRLGGRALVRYAAPAFATRGELETAQLTGNVLRRSGFVSPLTLGTHKIWTYQAPGLVGRGNPSGAPRHFETIDELGRAIAGSTTSAAEATSAVSTRPLGDLAEGVRYRNPWPRGAVDRWVENLASRDLGLTGQQLIDLRDYASVQSVITTLGGHWWLAAN